MVSGDTPAFRGKDFKVLIAAQFCATNIRIGSAYAIIRPTVLKLIIGMCPALCFVLAMANDKRNARSNGTANNDGCKIAKFG